MKKRKAIVPVLIIGFALVVLSGCGIGHRPYRHGNNGYHGFRSGDDYRNSSSGATYDSAGRNYHRRRSGYGDGHAGYCGW